MSSLPRPSELQDDVEDQDKDEFLSENSKNNADHHVRDSPYTLVDDYFSWTCFIQAQKQILSIGLFRT